MNTEECKLQFEDWAFAKGMVLDTAFFAAAENSYINPDTNLAYEIWLASRCSIPPVPELNMRMNCENCNQVYEREYSNGGKQCFGLVKDTFRDCDVIRACQKHDNGKMFLQDLSPDEAAEMATGYAAVIRTWFSFFYKRPCEICEQKEFDCNVAE